MSLAVIDQDAVVVDVAAGSVVIATDASDTVIVQSGDVQVLQVAAPSIVLAESSETSVVAVDGGSPTVVEQVESIVLIAAGNQGPAGVDGLNGSGAIEFPFSYGDATPANVVIAPAGKLVYGVQIHIKTPFDGVGAALSVGDAGQVDRLMSATENDAASAGSYTSAPVHPYGGDTQILLSITPGAGAAQGAGLVTVYIQQ